MASMARSSIPTSDLGDHAERLLAQIAELRLLALHQPRQIVISLCPPPVNLLPDERPLRHTCPRGRNFEAIGLDTVDKLLGRIPQRSDQHAHWRDNHDQTE